MFFVCPVSLHRLVSLHRFISYVAYFSLLVLHSNMDYVVAYPLAKKDLLKETSIYTSHEKIRNFRESCCPSKSDENLVRVDACEPDEPVCKDESCDSSGLYAFFYDTMFIKLHLYLPFICFRERDSNRAKHLLGPTAPEQLVFYPSLCDSLLPIRNIFDFKHLIFFRIQKLQQTVVVFPQ